MSAPLFSVAGLAKRFGEFVLFDGARLELEAGSGYVLTGANGTGKTTLLRVVAGLEPGERGRFAFHAQASAVSDYPEAWRREIIYVHQQPYLFHTSIEKNLDYGLARHGVPRIEREARVRQGLDPTLLLLDEPTANLDGDARKQVLELVTALCIENHTVVVASHDPEIIGRAILNRLCVADRRIEADD